MISVFLKLTPLSIVTPKYLIVCTCYCEGHSCETIFWLWVIPATFLMPKQKTSSYPNCIRPMLSCTESLISVICCKTEGSISSWVLRLVSWLIYTRNNLDPNMLPCGTPCVNERLQLLCVSDILRSQPRHITFDMLVLRASDSQSS